MRAVKQEQQEVHNTNMDLNTFGSRFTVCLSDKEKYSKDHVFLSQSSAQEYQTDLEVILEFLEEHYRQESGMKSLWPNVMDTCEEKRPAREIFSHGLEQEKTQLPVSAPVAQQIKADAETTDQALVLHSNFNGPVSNALKEPEKPLNQNTTPEKTTKPLAITPAQKGKKLRLFHFLFEVLEDPKMAHCVSWVPASTGVFRFSAGHKERVAELWGQKKGNRMPMTYQKMSRALRNYARSGEIIKVKKKLTYQFSIATLRTLKGQCDIKNASCGVK